LLELIDLINQEHEQNRDSWWTEEFQINFSEFEPKSVTPYCHGKYYHVKNGDGMFIVDYKGERISSNFDRIYDMIEVNGRVYFYAEKGPDRGVFSRGDKPVFSDKNNYTDLTIISPLSYFNNDFYITVRLINGSRRLINITTGAFAGKNYKNIWRLSEKPGYLVAHDQDDQAELIDLHETDPIDNGKQLSDFDYRFRYNEIRENSVIIFLATMAPTAREKIVSLDNPKLVKAEIGEVLGFSGQVFLKLVDDTHTRIFDLNGELIFESDEYSVKGIGPGIGDEYLFVVTTLTTEQKVFIVDQRGSILSDISNYRSYPDYFCQTNDGFILAKKDKYQDEHRNLILDMSEKKLVGRQLSNGQLFVIYYDPKHKIAEGHIVTK